MITNNTRTLLVSTLVRPNKKIPVRPKQKLPVRPKQKNYPYAISDIGVVGGVC